jgi:predicted DCC family thiol-disulfide oxidoreductase YuxK
MKETHNSEAELLSLLEEGPVLLYDGDCGVCNGAVQWILEHESQETLRFAPLESDLGRAMRERVKSGPEVDSLHWVEKRGNRIDVRIWSSAVLAVVSYTGGWWRILGAAKLIPRSLRDLMYRWFAKHRTKFADRQCMVPPVRKRARFLGGAFGAS